MLNLNNKYRINGNFSIRQDNYKSILSNDIVSIELNEQERMIFNHISNFSLKEIAVILQEFFQVDFDESIKVLDLFINRLTSANVITLLDSLNVDILLENKVYLKRKEIELIVEDDGTGVLRDTHLGKMLFVNKTGIEIWNFLVEENTIEDIVAFFIKKYSLPSEELKKDISEFLSILLEKDYVYPMSTN
jgi:hypothetical protein